MDQAFDRLHAAYFGNTPLPWEEFRAAALQYFDLNAGAAGAHDAYFNAFTVIWQSVMDTGRLDHAEHIWKRALQPAQEWEQAHQGKRLHKGTPYYFWAMTVLLRGDLDQGYLLMHQGVEEDILTSGQKTPDTPGYALVSLNFNKVEQAFRQWVVEQAAFLNDLIKNYTKTYQRILTIEDVKRRFIDTPPSVDAVFLLTYSVARLRKIAGLPDHVTSNPFAGQLQLNLLFDVTLVIDAAIKTKNQSQWKFIDHAEYLLAAASHQLTSQQLGEINRQFKDNFDTLLQAALDGTLMVQPNTTLDRLQCDVSLAYGLRNRGAHNLDTALTIRNRFQAVQEALFRVLCATIDYLY
ncbi:MAG TPA: hypothetical protein VNX26_04035 [Candidatus Acidoferrum sp.]|jgi:hypothetical protein|nr:hypothetical protein [Candidatus Acidoferrum sp.]